MAKQKTEAQIDRYNRFGAPGQWLAATVIGTISSATTFVNLVRTKYHDDNAFRQGFSVINKSKNTKLQAVNDAQIDAAMNVLKKYVGNHPYYEHFSEARLQINTGDLHEYVNDLKNKAPVETVEAIEKYGESVQKLNDEFKDGLDKAMRDPEFKKLSMSTSKKLGAVKGHFDKLYDTFAETIYGIKSKGLYGHTQGVWQRFIGFGGYTRRNMLIKTAAAAGVGFGGTMMAFNQLNNRDKLNEIDKQSERVDRKLDALLSKSGISDDDIETREEHRVRIKAREKQADRDLKAGKHSSKVAPRRAVNDNDNTANDNEPGRRHAASVAAERDMADAADMAR